MAFLGATAATYGDLGLLAGGIQSIGEAITGRQRRQAYDANAEAYEQGAEMARVKAALEEQRGLKQAASLAGHNTTEFVAAGVNPYTGSPVDHMVETLANAYYDVETEKYNTLLAAHRYSSEGKERRFEGRSVQREGYFKAGSTLLRSSAEYFQKKKVL